METPTITSSAYTSTALTGGEWLDQFQAKADLALHANQQGISRALIPQPVAIKPENVSMSSARIVKVFIADPNENLPLTRRVLHSGEEQLTDLTDQELFFEVPIADLLAKHNDMRKVTVDKKAAEKSGRDIFLEPARIRDLRMVVVTVAQF